MPRIVFTPHLRRHADCPTQDAPGGTVAEALEAVFRDNRKLQGYILDEQGTLRKHVTIFVDGAPIRDRTRLSDAVGPSSEIYVLQALSGG